MTCSRSAITSSSSRLTEAPEVFGMHPNANITFQLQETCKMMDTILSIQPRATSAEGGKSPDEIVAARR